MENFDDFDAVPWDHEPADRAERLGLRQSSGAFRWLAPIAKAPQDWRTPKPGGASNDLWKVVTAMTADADWAAESLENSLCYLIATVLRLLVANRRAMNSRSSGILHCLSNATARAGSDATQGSAAYQYIKGRL